ncbi:Hypothetical predicted protein [Cloeon dipterum]|uniref:Uncharacterized protein n=1 Tax=Cloeon dipterum TaxID=197152 RepID=A0A8S1E9Z3_9INSE|nr:Hypothetical predicted protein [Cloeon dipterum]CAB3388105.1 Hypothetical predicted protein [Cloeon dipterum]
MARSPPTLKNLCVKYLYANHDLKDAKGKLVITNFLVLPLSVRELFFELHKGDQCLISYSMVMKLVGRDTRHLNMKGSEPFDAEDFALDLRQKGVHQLRTLVVPPWREWVQMGYRIRACQLVPNESLVVLFMRQLHCDTKDMATFSYKFPNLREVTVAVTGDCSFERLSKLEHLKEFHFYYGPESGSDESDQKVADKLLYRLLRSVPNLTRAGEVSNVLGVRVALQNMSGGLLMCRVAPLNLTHVALDTLTIANLDLKRMLPKLTHLEMMVSATSNVQNYLNFPCLKFLQI